MTYESDEWIEWRGGACPVAGDTTVDYKTKCGLTGIWVRAKMLDWSWNPCVGDLKIVSYRLRQAAPVADECAMPEADHMMDDTAEFAIKHLNQAGDPHDALTFHKLPVVDLGAGDFAPYAGNSFREEVRPEPAAHAGVGDITSSAKGSGARYNAGKIAVDLLPLRHIGMAYLINGDLSSDERATAECLRHVGDYQARTRGLEALYDALLALAVDVGLAQVFREAAQVFEYGKAKYAAWNWAKGMAWSIPFGCIGRHTLFGVMAGEHDDPESKRPHRGHIACNIVMLVAYATCYLEGDDRPAAGMIGAAPVDDGARQAA